MDERKKYAILARLENEEAPKALAEEYDVSYATILRWRREYNQAKLDGVVDKVYNIDELILNQAMATVEAPQELLDNSELPAKLVGLERLDEDMQTVALAISGKLKGYINRVDSVSELEGITKCICDLRAAFFNNKGTQVAIQQNFEGSGTVKEKFGDFLAD